MQQGGGRDESVSPSYRDYYSGEPATAPAGYWDSPQWISAVEPDCRGEEGGEDDDSGEEFEFTFAPKDADDGLPVAADELLSGGRVRPFYPIFGRGVPPAGDNKAKAAAEEEEEEEEKAIRIPLQKLFLAERGEPAAGMKASSSASSLDELEAVPQETYCVWAPNSVRPSPAGCRKSGSTGSSSFRWRIRDLVMRRSQSDGKEKFLFFEAAPAAEEKRETPEKEEAEKPRKNSGREAKGKGKTKKGGKVSEVDVVTAHGLYYGRGGQAGRAGRRSFLPYKQDILGFFVNVNGFSQHHHPF